MAVLAGFGLAFAESGLGLGIAVPGETAVVAVAAAVDGPVALTSVYFAVIVGACAGDHLGYLLGRRYGSRMRTSRTVARLGIAHWDRAMAMVCRHGSGAVFVSRMLPLVRTLTPAVAGSAGLGYLRFVIASVAGSATWAAVYVGGGHSLGAVLGWVHEHTGATSAWLLAAAVIAIAVLALLVYRRRTKATTPRALPPGTPSGRENLVGDSAS